MDKTNCGHFADDTFIMYNNKKLKSIETIVNTKLKQVSSWLRLNKLSLNSDKTKLIFFIHNAILSNYDVISIKFSGKKLYPVDNIKYLGMYIDKCLSWNYHILQLSKKAEVTAFYQNFDIMHLLKHVYKYIMLYFIPTLFMDVINRFENAYSFITS